ncbi:MAG: carboxypeptidase-like regulatory domain-containing protein [Myxococcota bacterium]
MRAVVLVRFVLGATVLATLVGATGCDEGCEQDIECTAPAVCAVAECQVGECVNVPVTGGQCLIDNLIDGVCLDGECVTSCMNADDCDDENPCTDNACTDGGCVTTSRNRSDCESAEGAGVCVGNTCCVNAMIEGTAVDDMGQPIPNMFVGAAIPDSSTFAGATDNDGNYALEVRGDATYTMSAQTVLTTRPAYVTAEGSETVAVECGETATYDIDANRGYFLEAELVGESTITITTEARFVDVPVQYTIWRRALCDDCSPRFIVGIDGTFGAIADPGPGAFPPGVMGTTQLSLPPPGIGSYKLYAVLYPGSRSDDASGAPQAFYEDRWPDQIDLRYILLGDLEVVAPAE